MVGKFVHPSAFWEQLSQEEISHATALSNDNTNISAEQSIAENKFTRGVLQYVMDFVLAEIQRAEKNDIAHLDALNTALRVERSILEKKCFELFIPTNITIQDVFQKMNRETEQHIKTLVQELQKTLADS